MNPELPGAQPLQTVAPAVDAKNPGGQATHNEAPVDAAKEPGGHMMHPVPPCTSIPPNTTRWYLDVQKQIQGVQCGQHEMIAYLEGHKGAQRAERTSSGWPSANGSCCTR